CRDAIALADRRARWSGSQANCAPALHPQRTAVQSTQNPPLQERRELALPPSDMIGSGRDAESSRPGSLGLAPAGRGSYHDILARCAKFGEMRPYTSLNSTAARFYIGADRPDFAAAYFANPCSPDQNGLAR